MITRHHSHGLLHLLQSLYLKISRLEWYQRIHSYRQSVANYDTANISATLKQKISNLSQQHELSASQQQPHQQNLSVQQTDLPVQQHSQPVTEQHEVFQEFARHCKRSSQMSDADQFMANKLTTSIWSHLHIAFMQARQGDVRSAAIHAQIVQQALEQVAHYMKEDEYHSLFVEVDNALKRIQ